MPQSQIGKIRIGVVRGGPSNEYDVSLQTGKTVLEHMTDTYEAYDIFIDRAGVWHIGGIPTSVARIADIVDVVFNALHGEYGEDGKIQRELDQFGIPYTGSGSFASAVAMNKLMAKRRLEEIGVKMPRFSIVQKGDDVEERALSIFRSFPQPSVVKPAKGGSSIGVTLARDFNTFLRAIKDALDISDTVLVEEYVKGREASCGVIEDFRAEKHYTLPPVEIRVPDKHSFFDYDAKYSGETEEICPGHFNKEEKRVIMDAAKAVHKALDLRHYSRSDFIVSPSPPHAPGGARKAGRIYFLEVNTLPGLTAESLFPKALKAVGSSISEFLHHIIQLASRQNKNR